VLNENFVSCIRPNQPSIHFFTHHSPLTIHHSAFSIHRFFMIYLLSMDLMFPSRVRAAAAACGAELVVAMSARALDARLAERGCALLIIDLAACGVNLEEFVPRVKAAPHPPRTILAVGPHVNEALLRSAGEAGCDLVLTNGQFHAQMDEIVARYANVSDG
jgi:hypothetical protein